MQMLNKKVLVVIGILVLLIILTITGYYLVLQTEKNRDNNQADEENNYNNELEVKDSTELKEQGEINNEIKYFLGNFDRIENNLFYVSSLDGSESKIFNFNFENVPIEQVDLSLDSPWNSEISRKNVALSDIKEKDYIAVGYNEVNSIFNITLYKMSGTLKMNHFGNGIFRKVQDGLIYYSPLNDSNVVNTFKLSDDEVIVETLYWSDDDKTILNRENGTLLDLEINDVVSFLYSGDNYGFVTGITIHKNLSNTQSLEIQGANLNEEIKYFQGNLDKIENNLFYVSTFDESESKIFNLDFKDIIIEQANLSIETPWGKEISRKEAELSDINEKDQVIIGYNEANSIFSIVFYKMSGSLKMNHFGNGIFRKVQDGLVYYSPINDSNVVDTLELSNQTVVETLYWSDDDKTILNRENGTLLDLEINDVVSFLNSGDNLDLVTGITIHKNLNNTQFLEIQVGNLNEEIKYFQGNLDKIENNLFYVSTFDESESKIFNLDFKDIIIEQANLSIETPWGKEISRKEAELSDINEKDQVIIGYNEANSIFSIVFYKMSGSLKMNFFEDGIFIKVQDNIIYYSPFDDDSTVNKMKISDEAVVDILYRSEDDKEIVKSQSGTLLDLESNDVISLLNSNDDNDLIIGVTIYRK